jgi:hypothetical protein
MKKALCVLITVMLMLQLMPIVSFSEGGEDTDYVFTIGSASGDSEDYVLITLDVTSTKATSMIRLDELSYDSSALDFIEFCVDAMVSLSIEEKADNDSINCDVCRDNYELQLGGLLPRQQRGRWRLLLGIKHETEFM